MKSRLILGSLVVLESALLFWLFREYGNVEEQILLVQGQFPERYANLHRSWLQLAGGLVITMFAWVVTLYALVRTWRKK